MRECAWVCMGAFGEGAQDKYDMLSANFGDFCSPHAETDMELTFKGPTYAHSLVASSGSSLSLGVAKSALINWGFIVDSTSGLFPPFISYLSFIKLSGSLINRPLSSFIVGIHVSQL